MRQMRQRGRHQLQRKVRTRRVARVYVRGWRNGGKRRKARQGNGLTIESLGKNCMRLLISLACSGRRVALGFVPCGLLASVRTTSSEDDDEDDDDDDEDDNVDDEGNADATHAAASAQK